MKATVIWVIRHLLIPVAFICATGIPQAIREIPPDTGNEFRFTADDLKTLEITPQNVFMYADSLIAQRKQDIKTKGIYDPFDYFRDIRQFSLFSWKYHDWLINTPNGQRVSVGVIGNAASNTQALFCLFDASWRNQQSKNAAPHGMGARPAGMKMNLEQARAYWLPSERPDPNQKPCLFLQNFLYPILHWLLLVYLRGLPAATVLFLIWRLKLREDLADRHASNVPQKLGGGVLSFILSVTIWPFVLWVDIKNRLALTLRTADVISRRATMLSILSKSEEKILETGRAMSIREFSEYLKNLGMVRQHSFCLALLVAVFIVFIPRSVHGKAIAVRAISHEKVITNPDYGGPDIKYQLHGNVFYFEMLLPEEHFTHVLEILFSYPIVQGILLAGFFPDIGKVPKFNNSVKRLLT